MPELPEVETVKNVLEPIVVNHTITGIDILRTTSVPTNHELFISSLVGQKFLRMSRIGKFLIFHLTNNKVIISHLRMEGKYYELLEDEPNTKYARVVLHLDNGHKICYDDSRCFGYLRLSNEEEYLKDKEIAKLGPEPWDADIDKIIKQTKKMSLPIKSALLSQTLMTGLGNIYVDETLFASRIHPLVPANLIKRDEWETIKKEASRILKEAIDQGGSTIKSYHPGKDIDGNFQTKLLVYGKHGEDCPNCNHPLRFITVGGRGTTFCPICQPYHGKRILVAIFGPIASGKSEVLRCFENEMIPTLSTDKVVENLYKKRDVAKLVNKALNLSFEKEVDKDVLREHLVNHPKDINKINKLIHPLVKKETVLFIRMHKEPIIAVEVPLLFESGMDRMFDIIIGVTASEEKRFELLKERNKDKNKELQKIGKNNSFELNKEKADYIIVNSADLNSLKRETRTLINKLRARLD